MKIERIVSDTTAIFNSTNADKLQKEEKQVLSSDAVVFDSKKERQNQQTKEDHRQSDQEEPKEAGEDKRLPLNTDSSEPQLARKLDILA